VRLSCGFVPGVGVLVVLVVGVEMLMLQRLVKVFMFVLLGQMQPHTCAHERRRDDKTSRE